MSNSSGKKRNRWRWLRDRPARVNAVIVALVVVHAVLATHWIPELWPARGLAKPDLTGDVSVLFLGVATVATLTGGFAGVVVIFGLSNPSERFRKLRLRGGERLQANWTSVVSLSLLSAGLSLVAAMLRLLDTPGWIWTIKTAAVFVAHAAVRLVWLLRGLSMVVLADDQSQQEENERVPVERVVRDATKRPAGAA